MKYVHEMFKSSQNPLSEKDMRVKCGAQVALFLREQSPTVGFPSTGVRRTDRQQCSRPQVWPTGSKSTRS